MTFRATILMRRLRAVVTVLDAFLAALYEERRRVKRAEPDEALVAPPVRPPARIEIANLPERRPVDPARLKRLDARALASLRLQWATAVGVALLAVIALVALAEARREFAAAERPLVLVVGAEITVGTDGQVHGTAVSYNYGHTPALKTSQTLSLIAGSDTTRQIADFFGNPPKPADGSEFVMPPNGGYQNRAETQTHGLTPREIKAVLATDDVFLVAHMEYADAAGRTYATNACYVRRPGSAGVVDCPGHNDAE
jgi:hypothetical protein